MSLDLITQPTVNVVVIDENFGSGVVPGTWTAQLDGNSFSLSAAASPAYAPGKSMLVNSLPVAPLPNKTGAVEIASLSWPANSTLEAVAYVYMGPVATNDSPTIKWRVKTGASNVTMSGANTFIFEDDFGVWNKITATITTGSSPSGNLQMEFTSGDQDALLFNISNVFVGTTQGVERAFNPIWFRAESNLSGVTGYRYVFALKDENSVAMGTFNVLPDPDGVGEFDASRILKDRVSFDYQPAITTFEPAPDSSQGFIVGLAESVSGALVSAVSNQATALRLVMDTPFEQSELFVEGLLVTGLTLTGLNLSTAGPYYVRNILTTTSIGGDVVSFGLYTAASGGSPITATGTFEPNGFVQVTGNLIPRSTSDETETVVFIAINSAAHPIVELDWDDGDDYIMQGSTSAFLTHYPQDEDKPAKTTSTETLSFLQSPSLNVYQVTYRQYDSSDGLLATDTVANADFFTISGSGYNDVANVRLDVPVGPQNLDDMGYLHPDTSYYTVVLEDGGGNALSETRTYQVWEGCTFDYRIAFLNDLGGFDHADLRLVNETNSTEKSTYQRELRYGYTALDRGETVFHSQSLYRWQLITDFMSLDQAQWFRGLFSSPEVYLTDPDGVTRAVVVTTSESNKMLRRDKIVYYIIDVRDANMSPGNP